MAFPYASIYSKIPSSPEICLESRTEWHRHVCRILYIILCLAIIYALITAKCLKSAYLYQSRTWKRNNPVGARRIKRAMASLRENIANLLGFISPLLIIHLSALFLKACDDEA